MMRHCVYRTVMVAALALLCGCRAQQPCIPETITRDSIRVQHVLDSIYLYERDSIRVTAKSDTVFIERWRTRYKDVIKIQRDTILDTRREVQVRQVRYIPKFYKACTWIVCIAVVALVIWLVAWLAIRCRRI